MTAPRHRRDSGGGAPSHRRPGVQSGGRASGALDHRGAPLSLGSRAGRTAPHNRRKEPQGRAGQRPGNKAAEWSRDSSGGVGCAHEVGPGVVLPQGQRHVWAGGPVPRCPRPAGPGSLASCSLLPRPPASGEAEGQEAHLHTGPHHRAGADPVVPKPRSPSATHPEPAEAPQGVCRAQRPAGQGSGVLAGASALTVQIEDGHLLEPGPPDASQVFSPPLGVLWHASGWKPRSHGEGLRPRVRPRCHPLPRVPAPPAPAALHLVSGLAAALIPLVTRRSSAGSALPEGASQALSPRARTPRGPHCTLGATAPPPALGPPFPRCLLRRPGPWCFGPCGPHCRRPAPLSPLAALAPCDSGLLRCMPRWRSGWLFLIDPCDSEPQDTPGMQRAGDGGEVRGVQTRV